MALQTKDLTYVWKNAAGSNTYTYILRVTENSIDIVNNRSNVTIQAILKQTYSGLTFSTWTCGVGCAVNGAKLFYDQVQRRLSGTAEHVYYTWTGDIDHETNGQKTLNISGWFYLVDPGTFKPPSWGSEGSPVSMGAVALTTIPRASSFRASDADIESTSVISIQTNDTSFKHSIRYEFGGLSGYINSSGGHSDTEAILSGTSLWFDVPAAFYWQIPSVPYGICTLTLQTYSGSTKIGDPQAATFKATADPERCRPDVSGAVVDVNPATIGLTGDANILVRGRSTAHCTISATAKNGSSIDQKKIAGAVVSDTVLDIPNVEINSFLFQATDERGYSGDATVPKSMVPYILLTNNASAARTDPTNGNAVLTLEGKCYKGSFGAVENTLKISYRLNGEAAVEVTDMTWEDNKYSAQVDLSELDYQQSHSIEVVVEDELETVSKTVIINQGIPVFHWVRDHFNFNVPVTAPVMNNMYMQGIRFDTNTTVTVPVHGRGIALVGVMANSSRWGLYVVTNWNEPIPAAISTATRIVGDLDLTFSMEDGNMVIGCDCQWSYGWYIRNLS